MKTLLRITLLAAALMVTVLTTAGIATPDGSCITACYSLSAGVVYVEWHTQTQEECCGGLIPPCPAGYQAGWSSYAPYLKPRMACPPPM
jgi:hypothetical protein